MEKAKVYFTKELTSKEKPIIIEEAKMTLNNPYNTGYQDGFLPHTSGCNPFSSFP